MKLNAGGLEQVRRAGAFVRHRCDECGKVLNESFYYCLKASDDLRWCSRTCQDKAMGWESKTVPEKQSKPTATCQRPGCGAEFRPSRSDAVYCSTRCRMTDMRRKHSGQVEKSAVVTDNRLLGL
jgi:hypothetical protein